MRKNRLLAYILAGILAGTSPAQVLAQTVEAGTETVISEEGTTEAQEAASDASEEEQIIWETVIEIPGTDTGSEAENPELEAQESEVPEQETAVPESEETQVQEPETEAPETETQVQEPETEAPASETEVQESMTTELASETEVQESETEEPVSASEEPEPETEEPESETEVEEPETEEPESASEEPESETAEEKEISFTYVTVNSYEEFYAALQACRGADGFVSKGEADKEANAKRFLIVKAKGEIAWDEYAPQMVVAGSDGCCYAGFATAEQAYEAMTALRKLDNVIYAEQDGISMVQAESTKMEAADETAGKDFGALASGNEPRHLSWGISYLGTDRLAARLSEKTQTVVVAVLDTGVDYNHSHLQDRILRRSSGAVYGYDFSANDSDPMDEQYHGTHVAGTIVDVTMLTPSVKIMPVRVLDAGGSGYNTDVAAGIRWAVANGANVINMSLGGNGHSSYLENAVSDAVAAGVTVVVSAGNWDSNTHICPDTEDVCPADTGRWDGVITVSALTDEKDGCSRAVYSAYGDEVDVAAPGTDIYSSVPRNSYELLNGTSMAAPHIAGLAALLKLNDYTDTPVEIENTIKGYCRDLGSTGKDIEFGVGSPNLYRLSVARLWNKEPVGVAMTRGESHVYQFTAPSTGSYTFYTAGDLDTYLNLYSDVDMLNRLAYNDDIDRYNNNYNSRITYSLNAGTTVYLEFRGYNRVDSANVTMAITSSFPARPAAPSGLAASNVSTGIRLTWNAVSGATGYQILRSDNNNTNYNRMFSIGNTTSYTDTAVTRGKTYRYTIKAVNSGGESANATGKSITVKPAAPTNLTLQKVSNGVKLTWTAAAGATSYKVLRSDTNDTNYNKSFTVSSSMGTTYTDTSVVTGKTYRYTVQAVNAGGVSANAAGKSITYGTSKPAAPTNFTAVNVASGVKLTWTASAGATSYQVLRSDTNNTTYNRSFTVSSGTTYTDTAVTKGKTYRYTVKAVNAGGTSANAAGKSITVKPAAPTNFTATCISSGVKLTWTAAAGATSYTVLRSDANNTTYNRSFTVNSGTTYTDTAVTKGKTYRYTVRAVNAGGVSANAAGKSVTVKTAAPTNFKATNLSSGILLSWNTVSGATGYVILRSDTNDTNYNRRFVVGQTNAYIDSTAVAGKTYRYTVRAVNAGGESANAVGISIKH